MPPRRSSSKTTDNENSSLEAISAILVASLSPKEVVASLRRLKSNVVLETTAEQQKHIQGTGKALLKRVRERIKQASDNKIDPGKKRDMFCVS